LRSPIKISLEEYEKEGREETRKELAALFKRLEHNPDLTKHLPHVTQAMQENGKSTAQTERLRSLRKRPKPTSNWPYYLFAAVLISLIAVVAWDRINKVYELKSLPHAAQGTSAQLMETLRACTNNPTLYGLTDRDKSAIETAKHSIDVACVNLASPLLRKTPLHIASQSGISENVLILLDLGADVQATDIYGLSPLHLAKGHGPVSALIKAGANRYALDKYGKTPLFHLATEGELLAFLDGSTELFWKTDDSGVSALSASLRHCLVAESFSKFTRQIEKAKHLVGMIPSSTYHRLATLKDIGGKSSLSQALELASLPDLERRTPSAELLSRMLEKLARLPSQADVPPASELVAQLDLLSELVKADALGTLTILFSHDDIREKFLNVSQLDSHGRYPISYVRSAHVLGLLLGYGAQLHPLKTPIREKDPLHQILSSLSLHHASVLKQFHLVKALVEADPTFEEWMSSVPTEIKAAVERRFVLVNAEPMDWSIATLLLGLELLSEPTHQHYLRIKLKPQDYAELPHLLSPRSAAQFDLEIENIGSGTSGMISMDAHSPVDNIILQVVAGESQQTISSPNSFFGGMPRISLPIEKRSPTSPNPHFRVLLQCTNYITSCTVDFKIETIFSETESRITRTPVVHNHFSTGIHLYSIARAAAILWLPFSMLPKAVPIFIRFLPFFASLTGLIAAGPAYIAYWLAYTTISHIAVRMFAP
jgi:hypothetical protein